MHTPDLDADYRIARALREGTKLLTAFIEAGPTPPQDLREQVLYAALELQRYWLAGLASPWGCKVAGDFFEWATRCMRAVTAPEELEDEDNGTR